MNKNHKLRSCLLALIILLISSIDISGAEVINPVSIIYRESSINKTTEITYSFKKDTDGCFLKVVKPDETFEIISDTNYRAKAIHYSDSNLPAKVSVTREKNTLLFQGELQGKPINKNISIDDGTWYGSPFMWRGFILSDRKSETFFFAMLEDQTVIKDKLEEIKENNQTVTAQKVIMTFPDFRSAFWKAYYWFRVSDGIMLKTEELRGPPGTPKTTVELISES